MKAKQLLWRQWLKVRFHLFQRHRFNQLVLESVAGRPFLVLPEVFNPTLFLTSEFMVTSLNDMLIPASSQVLDMGTGTGVGAVFAAQWMGQVIAVDINPAAVRCARINVLLNGVEGCVDVREGDLFTAVPGEQFDVILFNPPYFRGEPKNNLDRAFRATDVLERFAAQASDYLRPGGWILLLLSSETAVSDILHLFYRHQFQAQCVAEKDQVSEKVMFYQLSQAHTAVNPE